VCVYTSTHKGLPEKGFAEHCSIYSKALLSLFLQKLGKLY